MTKIYSQQPSFQAVINTKDARKLGIDDKLNKLVKSAVGKAFDGDVYLTKSLPHQLKPGEEGNTLCIHAMTDFKIPNLFEIIDSKSGIVCASPKSTLEELTTAFKNAIKQANSKVEKAKEENNFYNFKRAGL